MKITSKDATSFGRVCSHWFGAADDRSVTIGNATLAPVSEHRSMSHLRVRMTQLVIKVGIAWSL